MCGCNECFDTSNITIPIGPAGPQGEDGPTGTPIESFNIISPSASSGDPVTVDMTGTASSTNVTGDKTFFIDRNGDDGDIVITIVSADGITFLGAVTSLTMAEGRSNFVSEFAHATGLAAAAYTFTLTWVGASVTKVQNVTITLS